MTITRKTDTDKDTACIILNTKQEIIHIYIHVYTHIYAYIYVYVFVYMYFFEDGIIFTK